MIETFQSQTPTQMSRKRIIKNLLCLSFGQCLVFTAFDSLSNLQSTLNNHQGIGLASQAVIYAFFTVSSFFLPTYVIRRVGCRTALTWSVLGICPYVLANVYPHWATLIPSAILCGVVFGPLWAARSTYINELSFLYSKNTNISVVIVSAWFFGISSFFHENAEIWGNVISYFVLKPFSNSVVHATPNTTLGTCGANFCNEISANSNPNLDPPPFDNRLLLTSIYLGFVISAALVITFFTDLIPKDTQADEDGSSISCRLLMASLRHLKNINQILLLPLSFYCGLADGFYNSDFTKAYIACAWGIPRVGYVTIFYGVSSAVMDCLSGALVKYLGRPAVFFFAAASHMTMIVTILLWTPESGSSFMYFLLSALYGVGASIWWSQIAAFYGIIFKDDEEAAFSNFYFWSSLGFLVAYSYSEYLCTYVKIYLLIVILTISIFCYFIVEYSSRRQDIIFSVPKKNLKA